MHTPQHTTKNSNRYEAQSSGAIIRLRRNHASVVGAFCGEPLVRRVHWTGTRQENCAGVGCSWCATGNRSRFRVLFNFYVPELRSMKVIEGGATWFDKLLQLRDKYGLDDWLFEVQRHGHAGDLRTSYSILPERKIDGFLRAEIAMSPLHDLTSIGRRATKPPLRLVAGAGQHRDRPRLEHHEAA